ncbi:MAG: mechanosensitive ion channel family protein [Sphaerochaetaceae bacterium]|nr:mechanosensitive ion channel family protein [Sphaerochaetaceae bacterium]
MEHTNEMGKKLPRLTKKTILKMVINSILILVGIVWVILQLSALQKTSAENTQKKHSTAMLDAILVSMERNESEIIELTRQYDSMNQEILISLGSLLNENTAFSKAFMGANNSVRTEIFQELFRSSGGSMLYLVDASGNVVASIREEEIGRSFSEKGFLSKDDIAYLTKCDETTKGTYSFDGSAKTYHPLTVQVPQSEEKVSIYSYPILDTYGGQPIGLFLLYGESTKIIEHETASLRDIGQVIDHATSDEDALIFAIDRNTGILLHSNQENLVSSGSYYKDSGLSESVLSENWTGYQRIGGTNYFCSSRTYQSEYYGTYTVITAAVASEVLEGQNLQVLFWLTLTFVVVAFLLLAHNAFLMQDLIKTKKIPQVVPISPSKKRLAKLISEGKSPDITYLNLSILKKQAGVLLLGIVMIFAISMYTQSIFSLGRTVQKADNTLGDLRLSLAENTTLSDEVETYYNTRYLTKSRMLATLLEEAPELIFNFDEARTNVFQVYNLDPNGLKTPELDSYGNPKLATGRDEGLQMLCDDNNIFTIFIFDENGYNFATNDNNWQFRISANPEDQSYSFRPVLDGIVDEVAQPIQKNEVGLEMQYFASVFYYYTYLGADGRTHYASRSEFESQVRGISNELPKITRHRGLLEIGITADYATGLLQATSIDHVFTQLVLDDGGRFMVFSADDDHKVLYSEKEYEVGRPASEIGFSDNAWSSNYYGFRKDNGDTRFVTTAYTSGYYIATDTPVSQIYKERNRTVSIATGISAIFLVITTLLSAITTSEEYELECLEKEDDKYKAEFDTITMEMPDGTKKKVEPLTSRWASLTAPWGTRTPHAKLSFVCKIIMLLYAVLFTLAFTGTLDFLESKVLAFILTGGWDKSLNIFSFTVCAMSVVVVTLFAFILDLIITAFDEYVGTRIETVSKLMLSILKYGSIAGAIFYCLYSIGINSTSLIASAGILSLVIGLGAQSLISDLLAGIFIAFGGDFRVGDIITIDSFRGQVVEIGLRTTKIQDTALNVKIYNNSQIKSVLNMTRHESTAVCTMTFDYDENIEQVETILLRELPGIRERHPEILHEPKYLGVSELKDSEIAVKVVAYCTEQNRPKVERILNKELLVIFQNNGIQIPFPQIVISQRKDTEEEAKLIKQRLENDQQ